MLTGHEVSDIIIASGLKTKKVTRSSLHVLVPGNREDYIPTITDMFAAQSAFHDKTAKGSSIGAVKVGRVKVIIKPEKPIDRGAQERMALKKMSDALKQAVKETGGPIVLNINGKLVVGVYSVKNTKGQPKSDFHFTDKRGKILLHVSHKKGSKPQDFQQWGGISEDEIIHHPEVQDFILRCRLKFGEKISPGTAAYAPIKDIDLKLMSVFGVDYDKETTSENRVDVIIQGDPGLKKAGTPGVYKLTATGNLHLNGDLPKGGFDPVLSVMYKGDRSQAGIAGARFSIYPKTGRNWTAGKV